MEQPLLVVLKHPGTLRYFKGGGPQSECKAAVSHQICDVANSQRKEFCVGGGVFAARVLVSLVDLIVGVPHLLEVLSEPVRVRGGGPLIEPKVVSGPTPPPDRRRGTYPRLVQQPHNPPVLLELRMVVGAHGEHETLGRQTVAGID